MNVGIFSDTHLGFDGKGERAQESFGNLEQALRLCIDNKADVVLLAGDVFDAPVPSHNTLYHALRAFSAAKNVSRATDLSLEKEGKVEGIHCSGLPLLAIHGNHEYLGKETRTALDVLNLAGLLVYFHAAKIIVEKGGERLVVNGLGAVPEKRALQVMQYWQPVPEKGATNVLMMHQAFKEFMAIDDEMVATLSLEDLPKGFDLVVDGHLHWSSMQKLGGSTFLLAGSTIATSIKRLEAEHPKGVHFFDTQDKKLVFVPLPNQRKMFYHQIVFREADAETVVLECKKVLESDLTEKLNLKPLIRLNLKGSLKKGLAPSDVNLAELMNGFSSRAILSLSKNFSAIDFKKKIADLREMQRSKLSIASLGFELLEKNLKETDFGGSIPAKELFDLLAEDDIDNAMKLATKK